MSEAQLQELAEIVETGPTADGVVRGRRVDLKAVIEERFGVAYKRFGVAYKERSVSKLLDALGFSPISARPQQPKQDAAIWETCKKTSAAR